MIVDVPGSLRQVQMYSRRQRTKSPAHARQLSKGISATFPSGVSDLRSGCTTLYGCKSNASGCFAGRFFATLFLRVVVTWATELSGPAALAATSTACTSRSADVISADGVGSRELVRGAAALMKLSHICFPTKHTMRGRKSTILRSKAGTPAVYSVFASSAA